MTTTNINRQANPSAATATSIYTCTNPGTISSIVVANRSSTATSFRIELRQLNAGADNKQYLYYDVPINGNDTFICTIGITCIATDQIYVTATLATLSFNLFGVEIS